MSHRPIARPRSLCVKIFGMAGLLALIAGNSFIKASLEPPAQHQEIHSVVSQSKLTPPLRSPEASLRYSPDGGYLLLQDLTGVTVLQRNPFRILIHISTQNVYPVEFSSDSRSLILVSRGLSYAKWRLPDGEKIAGGDLPGQDACVDGGLSPGGEFFACLKPDFHFALFDVSAAKSFFDESVAPQGPMGPGGLRAFAVPSVFLRFFVPLDLDDAFSSAFGVIRTDEARPNPNRPLYSSSIHFSPDAKTLFARGPKGPFGIDAAARKSFELPGAVQKQMSGAVALQTGDRLIAVQSAKASPSERAGTILSLKKGEVLANLPLSAGRLQIATNPRFVVLYNSAPDGQSVAAFDLEQSRPLDTPPAVALDIHADELGVYTQNGSIALYRIGERNLVASMPVPLSPLPLLRNASITPNLDRLAFSVDGVGAVFDVSSGQRLVTLSRFSAASFLDHQNAFLLFPRFQEDAARVSRVELSTGSVSPSWEAGKDDVLRSGGAVLLQYSLFKGMMSASPDSPSVGMQLPFTLHALEPGTGKELWKREFKENAPTPFADPQGERLVLGWKAKTGQAKSAASHNPAMSEALKGVKLTDRDTYFEVLDARSGNSVGGVLVTVGNGAAAFDTAFSAGDTLILQKDGIRVSLYSLHDGLLKSRLVGVRPSVSSESKLLALDMGEGRLGIFDLNNGTKLDEQVFPEALAYTHFSADGKRLFVLTEHQTAVILDVSNVHSPPAAPSQN